MRALALLLVACGSPPQPDCSLDAKDAIQGDYTAALVQACRDVPEGEHCAAADKLRDEYRAKIQEWESCR